MHPLLRVSGIEVTYHDVVTAVRGVSLDVPEGTVVGMIGANGAGKTSTLRAITGFLPSEKAEVVEGMVEFDGRSIAGLSPHRVAALGIGIVPERIKVFERLTLAENLRAVPAHGSARNGLRELVHGYFPVLAERSDTKAGYLSGGERQMLALAMALVRAPRLLLLDEPSLGLAPALAEQFYGTTLPTVVKDLSLTVLVVEQNARVIFDVADHVYVLENGIVVQEGPPLELARHGDVREFYLGMSGAGDAVRDYGHVKQYRRKRQW